jgi:hypothetical protein
MENGRASKSRSPPFFVFGRHKARPHRHLCPPDRMQAEGSVAGAARPLPKRSEAAVASTRDPNCVIGEMEIARFRAPFRSHVSARNPRCSPHAEPSASPPRTWSSSRESPTAPIDSLIRRSPEPKSADFALQSAVMSPRKIRDTQRMSSLRPLPRGRGAAAANHALLRSIPSSADLLSHGPRERAGATIFPVFTSIPFIDSQPEGGAAM